MGAEDEDKEDIFAHLFGMKLLRLQMQKQYVIETHVHIK